MHKKTLRFATGCALAAAAALVAGCGGSDAPVDPLARYTNQTLQWNDCSAYLQNDPEGYAQKLGDRLRCTQVQAPQDYQNPDAAAISISVMQVRAAQDPDKKPNLFFNPGGPGGDGQTLAVDFSYMLSLGNEQTALGRKYREVDAAYNFVGFSPRGVGDSTDLLCSGNQLVYNALQSQWGDAPANVRKLTDHALFTAATCQKNPVAAHIHTDATARDMDLMRHLLGDEELHYYGISYGTWLGFWYAGLFPERVGPMVLDSNMDFSRSIHEASTGSKQGQILTFNEFIAPYAARHDDVLGLGSDAAQVRASLQTVGREVAEAMIAMGATNRAEQSLLTPYLATLKAAVEAQKLLDQRKTLDEIAAILPAIPVPDRGLLAPAFRLMAQRMVQTLRTQAWPGYYDTSRPFLLNNEESVFETVLCNDEPLPNKDPAYWVRTGFDLARALPFVSNGIARQPCLYWNERKAYTKPDMAALQSAPMLMLQSQYDVPTPAAGAMETFAQLPAARMVYVENEGGHGLVFYGTECVDLPVFDHLLGKPGPRQTTCQGKPLELDASKAAAPDGQKADAQSPEQASNFSDPELAARLLQRLRQGLDGAARGGW